MTNQHYSAIISSGSHLYRYCIPVNALLIMNGFVHPFFWFQMIGVALSALIFMEAYFFWRYPEIIREEKVAPASSENNLNGLLSWTNLWRPKNHIAIPIFLFLIWRRCSAPGHTYFHAWSTIIITRIFAISNTYRVEEFHFRLANNQQYKHYTFWPSQKLGLTPNRLFNLAFKNLPDRTPRIL